MDGYQLGRDVQEIKEALRRIEQRLGQQGGVHAPGAHAEAAPDIDLDISVRDTEVSGGQLKFRVVGTVSCKGKSATFIDSTFTLSKDRLCEDKPEFKNDLFVVKDQRACLIFAEGVMEFCCVARFRPIPQTETRICKKVSVPLP